MPSGSRRLRVSINQHNWEHLLALAEAAGNEPAREASLLLATGIRYALARWRRLEGEPNTRILGGAEMDHLQTADTPPTNTPVGDPSTSWYYCPTCGYRTTASVLELSPACPKCGGSVNDFTR